MKQDDVHQNKTVFVRSINRSMTIRTERKGDMDVIREVIDYDGYRLTSTQRPEPQVILDIGSHIGTFTVLAHKIWPNAYFVCVEPSLRSFGLLQKNTEHIPNIRHYRACLEYDPERNCLVDHKNATGGGFIQKAHFDEFPNYEKQGYFFAENNIPSITLEKIIEDCHIERIDLAKFDCEGAEIGAFRKMKPETSALFMDIVGEYHIPGGDVVFRPIAEVAFPNHHFDIVPSSNTHLFFAKRVQDE